MSAHVGDLAIVITTDALPIGARVLGGVPGAELVGGVHAALQQQQRNLLLLAGLRGSCEPGPPLHYSPLLPGYVVVTSRINFEIAHNVRTPGGVSRPGPTPPPQITHPLAS